MGDRIADVRNAVVAKSVNIEDDAVTVRIVVVARFVNTTDNAVTVGNVAA